MTTHDKAIEEAYAILDNAHAVGFDDRRDAFRSAIATFLRAWEPEAVGSELVNAMAGCMEEAWEASHNINEARWKDTARAAYACCLRMLREPSDNEAMG